MELTTEEIHAFLRGEKLSDEKVEQIEIDLDNPNSEVYKISARSAELTRIAFDPEGPLFSTLDSQIPKEEDKKI